MRKRLVTDACKLRKLAESNLPYRTLQERHEWLVATASSVGYDLTDDDRVQEISGEIGEAARAAAIAVEISKMKAKDYASSSSGSSSVSTSRGAA